MATYQELVAQKTALDARIEEVRRLEVSVAVAQVKRLVGEYGLTASDCGFGVKPKKSGGKVPVKYRGQNGETWTGRGRAPAWVLAHESAGNSRESLLAH